MSNEMTTNDQLEADPLDEVRAMTVACQCDDGKWEEGEQIGCTNCQGSGRVPRFEKLVWLICPCYGGAGSGLSDNYIQHYGVRAKCGFCNGMGRVPRTPSDAEIEDALVELMEGASTAYAKAYAVAYTLYYCSGRAEDKVLLELWGYPNQYGTDPRNCRLLAFCALALKTQAPPVPNDRPEPNH